MVEKVILITGGSRGLGAEMVERLSSNPGYKIYFTYNSSGEKAQQLFSKHENVRAEKCDQRNEEHIRNCVASILETEGRLDVLVNNACPSFLPEEFLNLTWDSFQNLIDVNVKGAALFAQEASKAMKTQGGGKIINILTSFVIGVPPEKIAHYITAKYALFGLSKALAAELCKYGITVNMVSPGLMPTDLSGYLPKKYLDAAAFKHPMKRLTSTEDVTGVVEFLISDRAQFLNGVNLAVNGGENF